MYHESGKRKKKQPSEQDQHILNITLFITCQLKGAESRDNFFLDFIVLALYALNTILIPKASSFKHRVITCKLKKEIEKSDHFFFNYGISIHIEKYVKTVKT